MLGLDYAGGRPGGAAIAAAGYRFVVRYLTSGGTNLPGKLLTAAEYVDLQAHGIAVVANFETTADRMLAGFQAGVTDARIADQQIRTVGHPTGRPVYFSADFDATPAQQAEIDDYLRGATSVIGIDRVGVYGSYYVCKRCLDNHTATWAWQTGAWSGGNREPRAHLYQRIGFATVNGVQCDVNEALQPDFGQHPGDNMAGLSTEEHGWLADIHHESTLRLRSRRGDDASLDLPDDTVLGHSADAAAYGWRVEQRLAALQATITSLVTAVAAERGLSAADIRDIFDEELGKTVNVRISVDAPPTGTP